MRASKAWVFAKLGLKSLLRSVVASSMTVPFARWGALLQRLFQVLHAVEPRVVGNAA
jgi:hypothetical protein